MFSNATPSASPGQSIRAQECDRKASKTMKTIDSIPYDQRLNEEEALEDFPVVQWSAFEAPTEVLSFLDKLLKVCPLPEVKNWQGRPYSPDKVEVGVDFFGDLWREEEIAGQHRAVFAEYYVDEVKLYHPSVSVLVHELAHAFLKRRQHWSKKRSKPHGKEFKAIMREIGSHAEALLKPGFEQTQANER